MRADILFGHLIQRKSRDPGTHFLFQIGKGVGREPGGFFNLLDFFR